MWDQLSLWHFAFYDVDLQFCSCSFAVDDDDVTISNTVETGGIDRPGINLGGMGDYGSQQLLKSLNYVNGGYFPGTYAGATYPCSGGGSNTTTTWYNSITDASGYPANFWAGASFVAINAATGDQLRIRSGDGVDVEHGIDGHHLHVVACPECGVQSLAERCADRASDGPPTVCLLPTSC